MSTKLRLTAELQRQIVASIRAGGYAHVAAQAWGLSEEQWRHWLALGRRPGAREPYSSFYRRVREAQAQARLKAEIEALAKDPRFWLKNGPGKDPAASPGWAAPPRTGRAPSTAAEPSMPYAELMEYLSIVREVLAPNPEMLAALNERVPMPWPGRDQRSGVGGQGQEGRDQGSGVREQGQEHQGGAREKNNQAPADL